MQQFWQITQSKRISPITGFIVVHSSFFHIIMSIFLFGSFFSSLYYGIGMVYIWARLHRWNMRTNNYSGRESWKIMLSSSWMLKNVIHFQISLRLESAFQEGQKDRWRIHSRELWYPLCQKRFLWDFGQCLLDSATQLLQICSASITWISHSKTSQRCSVSLRCDDAERRTRDLSLRWFDILLSVPCLNA